MSRHMSGGSSCYFVAKGHPVGPGYIAESLGPAPADEMVSAEENAAFIEQWMDSLYEDVDH